MRSTFARYLVLQLPGLAVLLLVLAGLTAWIDLAPALAAAVLALWVLKDLVLYPFVRTAYERRQPPDRLIGRVGQARGPLEPTGWVRVGGELWRARLEPGVPPLPDGAAVRVAGLDGLTAVVEPAAATAASPARRPRSPPTAGDSRP